MAVPTRADEDRMDHAENQGRSGCWEAALIAVVVTLAIIWIGGR